MPAAAGSRRPQRGDVQRTSGLHCWVETSGLYAQEPRQDIARLWPDMRRATSHNGVHDTGSRSADLHLCWSVVPWRGPAMPGRMARTVQIGQPPDGEHVAGGALARRALADQHGHRRPGAVLLAALEARPARLARSPGCAVLATPGRRCARARLGCVKSSAPATPEQAALTTGRPGQVRLVRWEPRCQPGPRLTSQSWRNSRRAKRSARIMAGNTGFLIWPHAVSSELAARVA